MALPWVRLDSNIASHDKILALIADPSRHKWQAAASVSFAFAWSGGQGTDGFIPKYALQAVHGTAATAQLLVKYRLWDERPDGYQIRNFETRQELTVITDAKREERHVNAQKANCVRWHGKDCGCWRQAL
jgi:hypothetical protein